MSIKQKNSDTAAPKGSAWKKNVIFALVVLALAAGIFLAVRAQHPAKGSGLQAVVDFGDGVTETLPLAQDHDYLYEVGDYIVHLQVKDIPLHKTQLLRSGASVQIFFSVLLIRLWLTVIINDQILSAV